jgi:hypothetical protein
MNRSVQTGTLVVLTLLCAASALAWCSEANNTQWNNLRQVTHRATLLFVDRNRDCLRGKIKSVDDSAVMLTLRTGAERKIDRGNVFRVSIGGWPFQLIFSGRSSWSDVIGLIPPLRASKWHPKVVVRAKSGVEQSGYLLEASQDKISIKTSGQAHDIAKQEVSTVTYVRPKPASDSAQYANEELVFFKIFDPEVWPVLFHTQGSLSVRVYDATLSEDNSRITCNESP